MAEPAYQNVEESHLNLLPQRKHYWELYFLRGICIIVMLAFHFVKNIHFYWFRLQMSQWFWMGIPIFFGSIFLLCVGLSLWCSHDLGHRQGFKSNAMRGLKIVLWGVGISVGSLLVSMGGHVYFGVLHCIGISIIIGYPFLQWKKLNLFLGLAIVTVGWLIRYQVDLASLGLQWTSYVGLFLKINRGVWDYYPLFPFFGMVLLGIYAGQCLYNENRKLAIKEEWGSLPVIRHINFLGKHSLLIYLVHQPILVGIVYGLRGITS